MVLKILRLDFESYWAPGYSLKSQTMNMSEYVRDSRFKAHGASAGFEDEPIKWISHKDLPKYFRSIQWDKTALLCHNTQFDGFVLKHHYGYHPAFYLDTMTMGRILLPRKFGVGLNELAKLFGVPGKISGTLNKTKGIRDLPPELETEVAEYAIQDSQAMWDIFLKMEPLIPPDEYRLIDLTTLLFCIPVAQVNKSVVREEINNIEEERAKLFGRIARIFKLDSMNETLELLNSSDKMCAALRTLGREPPLKENDAGELIPALAKTDAGLQALQIDPDERVRALIAARLEAKSSAKLTRAYRFLNNADPALPIALNYGKPRTIRWSGGNKMNAQNLEREGRLRYAIEAPPGYKFNVVDSAQIEDRKNCWLSGQEDVLSEYRSGGDPYKLMATQIYNKNFDDIVKQERFVGKVSRLALGYQAGKAKFHNTLISGALGPPVDISREETDRAHDVYRVANDRIVAFWNELKRILYRMQASDCYETWTVDDHIVLEFIKDEIKLPNGLSMYYPGLYTEYDPNTGRALNTAYQSSPHGWSHIYEGKLCENICQALAKIVVADQILLISERYRVISTTHDEVWYLSHWREGLKPLKFGLECFSTTKDWYATLPVSAEGGQATSYGEAKAGEITLEDF